MNPYRDNNYYPVDYNNKDKQVRVKDNSNDLKYFLITISIIIFVIILCFINIIIPDNNENNKDKKHNKNGNELENITQTIIETEDGYKEETIFYTSVKDKMIVSSSVGSRRYLISYDNNSFNDYEFVEIGIQLYNDLEIGDKIKIVKTVYYNDKDKKLYVDNYIEKIKMF